MCDHVAAPDLETFMKIRVNLLFAALALGGMTSIGFAQSSTPEQTAPPPPSTAAPTAPASIPPTTDRATVRADARAAEKAGQIPRGQAAAPRAPAAASTKSRSEVRAEAKAIRDPMTQRGFGTEDQYAPKDTNSRAAVRASAKDAERKGEIPRGDAESKQ